MPRQNSPARDSSSHQGKESAVSKKLPQSFRGLHERPCLDSAHPEPSIAKTFSDGENKEEGQVLPIAAIGWEWPWLPGAFTIEDLHSPCNPEDPNSFYHGRSSHRPQQTAPQRTPAAFTTKETNGQHSHHETMQLLPLRAPWEELWKIHKYGKIEQHAPKQLIGQRRYWKGNQNFKNALRQMKMEI